MKKEDKQKNVLHSSKMRRMKVNKPNKPKQLDIQTVEDVWYAIQDGKIDLSYAIVGYTYSNGLPIFNSDDIATLLTQHGCDPDTIHEFLLDFGKLHEKNPATPILMMSKNKMQIYASFV